ncbi:methylated-DNA--[protein]-cysteine S-methyltransferase [Limisalsivibrio acetivorans]|uniref:methylated-DNA--[protein]-cysteine S-methyltransferase n=1 Tax=Limisalsivibrio acetivorans TaxID=1304888 RepID=UPI0003B64249|nr:MGMT family protein [Limisalsivibrio acetivorans]
MEYAKISNKVLGFIYPVFKDGELFEIRFFEPEGIPEGDVPAKWESLEEWLGIYPDSQPPYSFEEIPLSGVTDFRKRVYKALYEVPAGATVSYAELAEKAGSPKAARAVGSAMANNPCPVLIPCHRVLASGGKIGGFGGGTDLKKRMLRAEKKV